MEQKVKQQKPPKPQKQDWETIVFILLMTGMAIYYGWRMFALTPWYDELYTYFYFISRGPVYAAIHWPLPNNHIGYSVLSACLGLCGNSAIALRGISYLSSLGSLVLLYRLGRKCLDRGMALIPVSLYAGMKLVNQLAVQGRGYAFVTFCYLISLTALLRITVEDRRKIRDYLAFGISLVAALYAIPSSVYVVIPVCLIGGIMLLVRRKYGSLLRLICTAAGSAVCTVFLYGIVWLAIGSNLLMKTEGSAYYGMGHGTIILHAPFDALKTGIDYMLATPYIQSVAREGFGAKLFDWLRYLLNEYYMGCAGVLAVLLLLCLILAVWKLCAADKEIRQLSGYDCFLMVYLLVSILCIPLMLTIQCSLPYFRVFSFGGIVVAFAVAWLFQEGNRYILKRYALEGHSVKKSPICENLLQAAGSILSVILCVGLLCTPSYRAQYSDREAAIEDAYSQIDMTQTDKICVTDCDQEYLLLFLYGIGEERIVRQPEQAEVVLADKTLLSDESYPSDTTEDIWKMYLTPQQFEESGVSERMRVVYENDRFVLYQK